MMTKNENYMNEAFISKIKVSYFLFTALFRFFKPLYNFEYNHKLFYIVPEFFSYVPSVQRRYALWKKI